MAKFEEAINRKQKNIFVCKLCKAKVRAPSLRVSQGKVKCRSCKSGKLRPKSKK